MEQMLSPGFSIPSIGTPLHQPEADQQIVPNPLYHPSATMHVGGDSSPMSNGNANIFGNDLNSMGMPSLLSSTLPNDSVSASQKQNEVGYQPSYLTSASLGTITPNKGSTAPQSLMQPQTPVSSILKQGDIFS